MAAPPSTASAAPSRAPPGTSPSPPVRQAFQRDVRPSDVRLESLTYKLPQTWWYQRTLGTKDQVAASDTGFEYASQWGPKMTTRFLHLTMPDGIVQLPALTIGGISYAPGTHGSTAIVPVLDGRCEFTLENLKQPPVFRSWQQW
jgi:hypothetical protein